MELQPLVGASCAHCNKKILVDLDGKNCRQCGLAVHRACGKSHRAGCAGRPAVAQVVRDYDEVPPVEWTPRLIAWIAASAFVLAVGLGMLTRSPPEPRPGDPPPVVSTTRVALAWTALAAGLVSLAGAYVWTRSRRDETPRS